MLCVCNCITYISINFKAFPSSSVNEMQITFLYDTIMLRITVQHVIHGTNKAHIILLKFISGQGSAKV